MSVQLSTIDLKNLELEDLEAFVQAQNQPKYRAHQLMEWMYGQGVSDVEHMSNLPKAFRERLAEVATVTHLETALRQISQDGTRKYLFQLHDGNTIESVLIPEGDRQTLCISSQAGCGMACTFCATGLGGLTRNLKAAEIIDQVISVQNDAHAKVTNIVFMGMGEPLANTEQVLKAVRLLHHPLGLGMGMRRITVSTCGIIPGIRRLAQERLQIVLAVSLHAPTDEKRDRIMPINKKYPIEPLMQACREHVEATGRRITFEYVLLEEVNDTREDARTLGRLLSGLLCHVNLIPFNPVPETPFRRPSERRIRDFQSIVSQMGIEATVRWERGADIEAACGQLRRSAAEVRP